MKWIIVDTVQQHLENDHRLRASCQCGRSDWLDLSRLVELGHGDVPVAQLGKRLRCRCCGRKDISVQRHGPPFPSERAQEIERFAAERREKVRPFKRRDAKKD